MLEDFKQNKIIIADDDPIALVLLKSTLEKWGFSPITAITGGEVFELLKKLNEPALVLLDWLMPEMDGVEIVKFLRERNGHIPHYIIMLTSKNDKKDIVHALEVGADDFLSKPFDVDELKARIKVGIRLISLNLQLTKALKDAKRLANFIANYDQTTGLPNRTFFTEKIDETISSKKYGAILLVNIDKFKLINQAKGLDLGDILLNYFGARLKECFDDDTFIARIASDEFGILINFVDTEEEVILDKLHTCLRKIHIHLSRPFILDDEITLTVSIGAAPFFPEMAIDAEECLRRADAALRKAKSYGGNSSVIYDRKMEKEFLEHYFLEKELKKAIERDQIKLFLQAQVDSEKNFLGAEALIRWIHPQKGMISPAIFIPIAEKDDYITKIGRWVFEEVCLLLTHYSDHNFTISVNISPKHFAKESFVDEVLSFIEEYSVPANRFILEVTEGLLISDVNDVKDKMERLNKIGFKFSIDDFGTGYSSLSYLKDLPISEIKIDRNFIKDLPGDENSLAIVKAIFSMAKAFNMKVVAEGVETAEQVEFLRSLGEVNYQGFFFSKPEPAKDLLSKWLA